MTPEIDMWEYRAAIARNHDWLNGHHCPCDCCAVVLPKIAPPVKSTRVGALDPPEGPVIPSPSSKAPRYPKAPTRRAVWPGPGPEAA